MSVKEEFLNVWEREFQTTLKVLKAYPMHRHDFKPHEKSKSARDLAWTFVLEEKSVIDGAIAGQINFQSPPAPATMKDVIAEYEKSHKDVVTKVKALSDEDLNKTVKVPIGPKKMGDLRKIDLFWTAVMDMIHHRGQLSVYLRLTDGKVPSIYGPSADEPW